MVVRDGRVHRPAHQWSKTTREIVTACRNNGLKFIPEWLGTDSEGNELFEYIEGTVGHDPLTLMLLNDRLLQSAGRSLRLFHDACSILVFREDLAWQFEAMEPRQVVCHGDFAPYNCIFEDSELVGLFDFDAARVGPRSWELSYALYRFAPFVNLAALDDGFGPIENRIRRARIFIEAYGGSETELRDALNMIPDRLQALIDWMKEEANAGNPHTIENLKDGHHLLYESDARHMSELLKF